MGKYQGKSFQDTVGNDRIVSLGTSGTSRVDIVKGVAPAIVSHFPGGS